MSVVIQLENVSKQYRLGLVGTKTLRGDVTRWWHRMQGKEDPTLKIGAENRLDTRDGEYVWALRDINLEVKQGEILGIIGKNGAGKSTLLKLLSRVTGPTTGNINVKGRIASLLEVGTGFHPELTGRENVFLNGAILGMTKREIESKLEEIVDFAGVAKYLDTPVKRYSSGMYVRLAFSVAAHLEPEILIVDEVLAVGDVEFREKATGKIKEVSKGQGRTVIFVSHNMASIEQICTKSALLSNGLITMQGDTRKVIREYMKKNTLIAFEASSPFVQLTNHSNKSLPANEGLQTLSLFCNGLESLSFYPGCTFEMRIKLSRFTRDEVRLGFLIKDENGQDLIAVHNQHVGKRLFITESTPNREVVIKIEDFPIYREGKYLIDLFLGDNTEDYDVILNAVGFEVREADVYGSGRMLIASQNLIYTKQISYSLT